MSKDLQFTFKRPSLEISGEVGSLAELIGYMQEESATLTMAFGDDMELVVQRINGGAAEQGGTQEAPKRGRKPKVDAVAPAPLPVPSEAPTSATLPPNALPTAAPVKDDGIPEVLRRTPAPEPLPTAAAPPLAPVAPAAPLPPLPAAAAPPPVGVLGPKVVAAFDALRVGKEDGGQALADWLAASGLTQAGADYDAAMRVVLMTSDEKLRSVADALKVV